MSEMRIACNHAPYSPRYTKFIKANHLNLYDGKDYLGEIDLSEIKFFIHQFTNNQSVKKVFLFALVEFGCELFLPHYFLEDLRKKYNDSKLIIVGWQGRAFLYEKFVDEFWEISSDYMWLRDYTKAFQHSSKNIKKLENCIKKLGVFLPSNKLGNLVLENICRKCGSKYGSDKLSACPNCNSMDISKSMFADLPAAKIKYKPLEYKNKDVSAWVESNMPKNMFGIFARDRKAYGRNLDASFYMDLIEYLKDEGFNPVWLGEQQSVLPCPDQSIIDFSSMKESLDLRYTLEVISRCACTFQCWTASTRLSQITNTPFVLVESVDQIYGKGQEGKRLFLFAQDFAKQKIILCNYHKVLNNMELFGKICKKSIEDFIINKDSDVVLGLVDNPDYVESAKERANLWKTNLKKITLKDM